MVKQGFVECQIKAMNKVHKLGKWWENSNLLTFNLWIFFPYYLFWYANQLAYLRTLRMMALYRSHHTEFTANVLIVSYNCFALIGQVNHEAFIFLIGWTQKTLQELVVRNGSLTNEPHSGCLNKCMKGEMKCKYYSLLDVCIELLQHSCKKS